MLGTMLTEKETARFWTHVSRGAADECWEWGSAKVRGYGMFWLHGGHRRAHRVAFAIEHGRWPDPCCLHRCDNASCVNPAHLEEGTVAENNRQMVARARQARGPALSAAQSSTHPRGELHHAAKLTWPLVRALRAEGATQSVSALARRYGVTRRTIRQALDGETWKEPA